MFGFFKTAKYAISTGVEISNLTDKLKTSELVSMDEAVAVGRSATALCEEYGKSGHMLSATDATIFCLIQYLRENPETDNFQMAEKVSDFITDNNIYFEEPLAIGGEAVINWVNSGA